jgi:hypothetical protein
MTPSRQDRMAPAGGRRMPRYAGDGLPPRRAISLTNQSRVSPTPTNYLSINFLSFSKPEYTRVLAVLTGQP